MLDTAVCRVRVAGYDDIKVMLTLLKELSQAAGEFTFNAVRQRAGLRRMLKQADAAVLVAERDRLIVGMCTIQTVIAMAEGGLAGLVENLIVHDSFRGQGVGRALLSYAERWAAERRLVSWNWRSPHRARPPVSLTSWAGSRAGLPATAAALPGASFLPGCNTF
jgi:GNAT superfamily N-acetyltransferase